MLIQLEAHKQYTLSVDQKYSTPNYDLEKINLNGAKIQDANMSSVVSLKPTDERDRDKDINKVLLWIGSIIGVAIVFFFGFKLLKEMQQSKNESN